MTSTNREPPPEGLTDHTGDQAPADDVRTQDGSRATTPANTSAITPQAGQLTERTGRSTSPPISESPSLSSRPRSPLPKTSINSKLDIAKRWFFGTQLTASNATTTDSHSNQNLPSESAPASKEGSVGIPEASGIDKQPPDMKGDEHYPGVKVDEYHPDVKVEEHSTGTSDSECYHSIDDDTSNGQASATSVLNSPSPELDARQSEAKPEPMQPPLEQVTSSLPNLAESPTELTRPEIPPTTSSEDTHQAKAPSRAQPAAPREECAVKNCGAASDIFWCSICDTVLCSSCWSKQVAHQDKGGREKHLQNELRLKTVLSSLFVSGACVENDESKFKWFEVNAEGHITTTHRYTELSVDAWLDRPRYPALLSFVGDPGAGKSTLIKALMKWKNEEPGIQTPVIQSIITEAVELPGACLYADQFITESDTPWLYADTNDVSLPTTNLTKESGPPPDQRSNRQTVSASKPSAKETCTRILLTLADVVVYVTRNLRTIEETLVKLIIMAKMISRGQPAPYVVVVVNAVENAAYLHPSGRTHAGNQSHSSSRDFDNSLTDLILNQFAHCVRTNPELTPFVREREENGKSVADLRELILCYYTGIRIICIPDQTSKPSLVLAQCDVLKTEVHNAVEAIVQKKKAMGLRLNSEDLDTYFETAFHHFCKFPSKPFDFVDALPHQHPMHPTSVNTISRMEADNTCKAQDTANTNPTQFASILLDGHRKGYPQTPPDEPQKYAEEVPETRELSGLESLITSASAFENVGATTAESGPEPVPVSEENKQPAKKSVNDTTHNDRLFAMTHGERYSTVGKTGVSASNALNSQPAPSPNATNGYRWSSIPPLSQATKILKILLQLGIPTSDNACDCDQCRDTPIQLRQGQDGRLVLCDRDFSASGSPSTPLGALSDNGNESGLESQQVFPRVLILTGDHTTVPRLLQEVFKMVGEIPLCNLVDFMIITKVIMETFEPTAKSSYLQLVVVSEDKVPKDVRQKREFLYLNPYNWAGFPKNQRTSSGDPRTTKNTTETNPSGPMTGTGKKKVVSRLLSATSRATRRFKQFPGTEQSKQKEPSLDENITSPTDRASSSALTRSVIPDGLSVAELATALVADIFYFSLNKIRTVNKVQDESNLTVTLFWCQGDILCRLNADPQLIGRLWQFLISSNAEFIMMRDDEADTDQPVPLEPCGDEPPKQIRLSVEFTVSSIDTTISIRLRQGGMERVVGGLPATIYDLKKLPREVAGSLQLRGEWGHCGMER